MNSFRCEVITDRDRQRRVVIGSTDELDHVFQSGYIYSIQTSRDGLYVDIYYLLLNILR